MTPEIKNVPPEVEKLYELAEQAWEGCDGCDENDKHFWMNGFRAGYNRAKPDVISDEEALRLAKEMNKQPMTFVPSEISDEEIEKAAANLANPNADKTDNWIEGAKWYREQLKSK